MPDVNCFGPYELRELVGKGGMGEVYRAYDRDQAREVALKLLPAELAVDDGFVERFRRESYAAARLNEPHVVPIHRYGAIDGRLYIDMRLVDGTDLAKVIAADGPMAPDRAVLIVSQAAQALDAAHSAGLVHRDVKPSNLLVTPHDFVYLVDFGIAHVVGHHTRGQALTAAGATIGTLDYMAPERFGGGNDVDARADVYSLACVLYEILTGQRPFPIDTAPALMHAHLTIAPPDVTALRPDLPVTLNAVIARGMAKDVTHRYGTAGELAAAAQTALRHARSPVIGAWAHPAAPHPVAPRPPEHAPAPTYVPQRMTPPPWPPPYAAAPAPPAPRSRATGAWLVGALSIVIISALVGVLLGRAGAESGAVAQPPDTITDGTPQPATSSGALPSPTTAPSSPAQVGPAQDPDLGLAVPISSPPCIGQFAVFVFSAVAPSRYREEVAAALAAHPGSSYLLTEASCSSLRARYDDGSQIYSVYLGPFATFADACAVRDGVGGTSYVKVLDNVSPDDLLPEC